MNFLENIFEHLRQSADQVVAQEIHGDQTSGATGGELLQMIETSRGFLRGVGVQKGDRVALLAPNSIHWAAIDLAIIAEGGIVVPLYSRQPTEELVGMMRDSSPALIICGDVSLRTNVIRAWPEAPPCHIPNDIFTRGGSANSPSANATPPAQLALSDPVTIIYTSGTSGEPKGVVLTVGNLNHVLGCTTQRLDALMGRRREPERVFHYAPFCFAAAWILLLNGLSRNSVLLLCVDLSHVASDMRRAAPDYFTNVPIMLERMRSKIEEQFAEFGGLIALSFRKAQAAWLQQTSAGKEKPGGFWLAIARLLVFPAVRKRLGTNLKALICGSAALAPETQQFFMMLGLPVLQVYGLTETTGICTMDSPSRIRAGWVGTAMEGVEMRLGDLGEILVRGPNVFPGYWRRPEATRDAFRDGWFRTGDQGEVTPDGYWRITGRIKNLIVLSSGHNVAPEPIEEKLLSRVPGAQQVVLIGNGRPFLSAIVTGPVTESHVKAALDELNPQLPHYKRIHEFHVAPEPFSADNGLLTINGKLKRDAIAGRYANQIESLYQQTQNA
jgi:long-chain acyl-CoA synthetase